MFARQVDVFRSTGSGPARGMKDWKALKALKTLSYNVDDKAGSLIVPIWFNFLQSRVYLPRIQGNVYDRAHTAQAENLSAPERLANSYQLSNMLCDWRRSVPDQLQPHNFAHKVHGFAVRHFLLLYFTYFRTYYTAHRIFSHDAEWIVKLVNYSPIQVNELERGRNDNESENLLPAEWPDIVYVSRTCMGLFRIADQSDSALVWNTSCTYLESNGYIILMTLLESNGHIIFIDAGTDTSSLCRTGTGNVSALIILVANNPTFPEQSLHDYIDEDMQLIREGLQFLENIARLMDNEGL